MKDQKQLIRELNDQGYTTTIKKSGHCEVVPSDARVQELKELGWAPPGNYTGKTTISVTPSDPNAHKAARRHLRRWVGFGVTEAATTQETPQEAPRAASSSPRAADRRAGILVTLQSAGAHGLSGPELVSTRRDLYPKGSVGDNLVRVLDDLQVLAQQRSVVRFTDKEVRPGSSRRVYVWAARSELPLEEPTPEPEAAPEPEPEAAPEPEPEAAPEPEPTPEPEAAPADPAAELEALIDMIFELPISTLEHPRCRQQLARLGRLTRNLD